MASINTKPKEITTHAGGPATPCRGIEQIRRLLLSCMLWEDQFYVDGKSHAELIEEACKGVKPEEIAALCVEARTKYRIRHASLLLAVELCKYGPKGLVADTVAATIQRADELAEIVALYWRKGKRPLSKGLIRGIQLAWLKFDEYQLAKYDRPNAIKLRDVMRLTHPKPTSEEQSAMWKRLLKGELKTPDTWEVRLSRGDDKKESFEDLLDNNKLGYMALLRNLRNMKEAGIDKAKVADKLLAGSFKSRALPFRFIAAAQEVPLWEDILEAPMLNCMAELSQLHGLTLLLVDNSGSMQLAISRKSQMKRIDAACGLAILAKEMCERCDVYAFSNQIAAVPPRRGFALRDAITASVSPMCTLTGAAIRYLNENYPTYDRVIVITDEQTRDWMPPPKGKGYIINVGAYQNGIGYGTYTHVTGFSEATLAFIAAVEAPAY